MPFFDANKMGITIDYDDNMCLVGGSLRGVVNIFVRETVSLCGASLRYRILEGCSLSKGRFVGNNDASPSSPDSYNLEYVLFGARSTREAPPIRVQAGHYSYPFAIPIPAYAPPTQRFGGSGDPSLMGLFGKDVSPNGGPCGPAVRVEHLVEVVVYVAHSWKDKHQSRHAPCVVSCTTPSHLLSPNNGMEGHIRNGQSLVYPGRGLFSKLFNSGPTKSKEQADCDLFIYNTTVSLADSPFLHFAIRGKTNCPYRVELVRVVQYTHPLNERKKQANQTDGANADDEEQQSRQQQHQRPPIIDEQVISSTTMPPLDSQQEGVRGRLLISPFAQDHSVSFCGRQVRTSYFVTMSLQYLTNKSTSAIAAEHRMRIPVSIYHGTFEEAIAGTVEGGYPVTGAVMGYDAPPAGEHALFRPAAPVTDSGVTSTQWSDPNHEPHMLRPTMSKTTTTAHKTDKVTNNNKPSSSGPSAAAPNAGQTDTQAAHGSVPSSAFPDRPRNEEQQPSHLQMERLSVAEDRPSVPAGSERSSQHYQYSAPAAGEGRQSAHRRMFDDVAPSWVRAERAPPVEPVTDFEAMPDAASGDADLEKRDVTTTTII